MAAEEGLQEEETPLPKTIKFMVEVNQRKIKCPIFSAREKFIQELNRVIWRAARGEPRPGGREDLASSELMNKAHSLLTELDILSGCPKYNQENSGCRICKAICNLRKGSTVRLTGLMTNLPSFLKEKMCYSYSQK